MCIGIVYTGGVSCFDSVLVQQKGDRSIPQQNQIIIPRANFTCNGRITGITASMDRSAMGVAEPSFEVWRPRISNMDVFDKVGEVQLAESEVIQVGHDLSTAYWLVDITLTGNNTIEFEAGDVIGYYHPHRSRYQVWTILTAGYTAYRNTSANSLNTVSTATQNVDQNAQPLIQFSTGLIIA